MVFGELGDVPKGLKVLLYEAVVIFDLAHDDHFAWQARCFRDLGRKKEKNKTWVKHVFTCSMFMFHGAHKKLLKILRVLEQPSRHFVGFRSLALCLDIARRAIFSTLCARQIGLAVHRLHWEIPGERAQKP